VHKVSAESRKEGSDVPERQTQTAIDNHGDLKSENAETKERAHIVERLDR
jgi:hypothetical protein